MGRRAPASEFEDIIRRDRERRGPEGVDDDGFRVEDFEEIARQMAAAPKKASAGTKTD